MLSNRILKAVHWKDTNLQWIGCNWRSIYSPFTSVHENRRDKIIMPVNLSFDRLSRWTDEVVSVLLFYLQIWTKQSRLLSVILDYHNAVILSFYSTNMGTWSFEETWMWINDWTLCNKDQFSLNVFSTIVSLLYLIMLSFTLQGLRPGDL